MTRLLRLSAMSWAVCEGDIEERFITIKALIEVHVIIYASTAGPISRSAPRFPVWLLAALFW